MTFSDLNLNKALWNALDDLDITEPTAIQQKVFNPLMAGKDVVGIAQTGTGKTFAYLLPILRLWKFSKSANPRILIVVPTRELVAQVVDAVNSLTTYLNFQVVGVYGGANIRVQKAKVYEGLDMIVGTPGRLVDLMRDNVLKTKELKQVVIDEVDEMLNLGFRTQLRDIIDFMPKKRQHMMFSATITEDIGAIIDEFTDRYERIEAAPSGAPLKNIIQYSYSLPNFNSKANLFELLLEQDDTMKKVLVFTATKKMADALFHRMEEQLGERVGIIHSSKSQNYRFRSVENFDNGSLQCLIATDIIARGLDVSQVTHVVNFNLPDTAEKYIHRIGRTGRAEQKGISIAFVSEDEIPYQKEIEALMGAEIEALELPDQSVITDELIRLEKPSEYVPFNVHKTKKIVPSGPAFHEKLPKNQKVNMKVSYKEKMKKKYKKPKTRGAKRK